MNIKIGSTELKLHKAEKNTYPKGIRSFVEGVTVNGKSTEYHLTTGIGRDGEKRRYIHVRVEGVHMWAKITDDVTFILAPAETTKPIAPVAPVVDQDDEASDE